jgi:hypothetical protein
MFMRALVLSAGLVFFTAPALAQTAPAPAPLPDGAVAVSADQNGQSIEAAVGAQVAIQLQRSGSIGTNWTVAAKPDFLGDASQLSGPAVTSARPVLGAPSWQVFVFPVAEAGAGEVKLEKHDRSGAAIDSFTVTINATAP